MKNNLKYDAENNSLFIGKSVHEKNDLQKDFNLKWVVNINQVF